MATIRIIGLANGEKSEFGFEGQYIVKHEPPFIFETTWYKFEAKQFPSAVEAVEYWQAVDPTNPIRPDGKPNRPLTAFTVEIE